MKIVMVISSLFCGGAERVLVLLAQGFIEKGYQVTVVTLSSEETDFYTLPKGASRIALSVMKKSKNPIHAIVNNLYRLLKLRQVICLQQPDFVISFLTEVNILTILSMLQTGYPAIVTEHCDSKKTSYGISWEKLRRFSYKYAAKVVSVSQGVDEDFDWLPKTKRAVIYNPFLPISVQQEIPIDLPKDAAPEKDWIISMGRLNYQKGFDILLSAFAKIAHRYPNWQLLILGEGHYRKELEALKEDLGLSVQAILPGAIKNPFPILKKAKLFVMSSRFEGFPMSHGEAMACGLPVIATDCPSGPREIIRHGIDGILIKPEDVSELATAMEHLMSDRNERQRLADRAPEVTQRFSLEKVMEMWEKLFEEIKNQQGSRMLKDLVVSNYKR